MELPRKIQTVRLMARPMEETDARPIFEGWGQDDQVLRYLTWPRHTRLSL
jgi:RimJ/RimL family protein N-acetyltransferase